jgi:hypothetical protein
MNALGYSLAVLVVLLAVSVFMVVAWITICAAALLCGG